LSCRQFISLMSWSPINTYLFVWLTQALTWWCQRCIVLSGILITVYCTGWLHRFLWFMAEREAKKILNGTHVTSSTFQIDIFRGKVWISNLIIHAPKQDTWQWEAPVFARIGKVYVEVNLVSCLFSLWFLWEELPLDLYTISVSDIQVFIERKHNVYNFLLLDPHVVVPVPPQPHISTEQTTQDDDDDLVIVQHSVKEVDMSTLSKTGNSMSNSNDIPSRTMAPSTIEDNNSIVQDEEEKAQHLVEHIVDSVRRATVVGGDTNPVASLLDQYRHMLTNQLKAFTTEKETSSKASTTAIMQESVNLIKHVTANIAEKTVQAQQVIIPARRSIPGERPVYGRVGRVLMQDMRIFVRENHRFNSDGDYIASTDTSNRDTFMSDPKTKARTNVKNDEKYTSSSSSWHQPIIIQRVAIRANEFCPPSTTKEMGQRLHRNVWSQTNDNTTNTQYDENRDNYDAALMPALYQTMDVYVDIAWKRVLAEVAKSNTGQFFQTAMGEVVNLFVEPKETSKDDIVGS
jgi:hypothetical protein